MQKFIVPDINRAPSRGTITGRDARHMVKVLRMNAGQCFTISNGRGHEFSARILSAGPDRVELEILSELDSVVESPIHITLCSGMLKDNKMDLVIQYATQLGIQSWIPFFSERSIPRPDAERLGNRLERWRTIAAETLKQCRRNIIPEIIHPLPLNDLLADNRSCDLKLAFWEKEVTPLKSIADTLLSCRSVMILIGPEGGFSEQEIQTAKNRGFKSSSLGPRILRAETAAMASCTLVQHLFGDM